MEENSTCSRGNSTLRSRAYREKIYNNPELHKKQKEKDAARKKAKRMANRKMTSNDVQPLGNIEETVQLKIEGKTENSVFKSLLGDRFIQSIISRLKLESDFFKPDSLLKIIKCGWNSLLPVTATSKWVLVLDQAGSRNVLKCADIVCPLNIKTWKVRCRILETVKEEDDIFERLYLWTSPCSSQCVSFSTKFLDLKDIILPIDVYVNYDRINYKYHLLLEAQKLIPHLRAIDLGSLAVDFIENIDLTPFCGPILAKTIVKGVAVPPIPFSRSLKALSDFNKTGKTETEVKHKRLRSRENTSESTPEA